MSSIRASLMRIALAASALTASSALQAANPSAQVRTLIDNDKVHVSLVELPVGHLRLPHGAQRSDQILVYLDDAVLGPERPGAAVTGQSHPRGTIEWLSKQADGVPVRVIKAHRALYVELKHGTMSAPDPAAIKLPPEPAAGGGAPTQVLLDNDQVRATLISYPQGFIRPGGFKRRLDTLIVYIDDARLELPGPAQRQYSVIRSLNHPDAIAVCDPIKDCDSVGPDGKWVNGSTLVTGTVAWHPKDGFVNRLRIAQAYRALYIELKQ
jgi:hypothetical protein